MSRTVAAVSALRHAARVHPAARLDAGQVARPWAPRPARGGVAVAGTDISTSPAIAHPLGGVAVPLLAPSAPAPCRCQIAQMGLELGLEHGLDHGPENGGRGLWALVGGFRATRP